MERDVTRPGSVPATLVLEDGLLARGTALGAVGCAVGELVFCTGMTGYQETLTDPSFRGQIVLQTAPQIGNTGWNDEDGESSAIQVSGYVVSDPARRPSNWRSRRGLVEELTRQDVVGLSGVDTRALTRHVRDQGTMRAGVFSGSAMTDRTEMRARVLDCPPMAGTDLARAAGTAEPYVFAAMGKPRFRVAALDLGVKSSALRMLSVRGVETHVLPPTSGLDDVLARRPNGVFLTNGPGDPAAMASVVTVVREVLARRLPLFGICFGNQLLGRALGRDTYKLPYGHRGNNVPVIDARTGRVAITAQNHGFAVAGEPGEQFGTDFGLTEVSHHCPNDGVVEGLRCLETPAFSAQFHPEASAGPHDAETLFDDFIMLLAGSR
jgi:carbamoyl-phosphate synthase small subunit